MEYVAVSKSVRVAPRKVRLVADVLRNRSLKDALSTVSLTGKIASKPLEKTLRSALANAVFLTKQTKGKEPTIDSLSIKRIEISEGPSLKRFHPSTRGRIHSYKKRSSHIKIVLTDDKTQQKKGAYGTKS